MGRRGGGGGGGEGKGPEGRRQSECWALSHFTSSVIMLDQVGQFVSCVGLLCHRARRGLSRVMILIVIVAIIIVITIIITVRPSQKNVSFPIVPSSVNAQYDKILFSKKAFRFCCSLILRHIMVSRLICKIYVKSDGKRCILARLSNV